MKHLLMAAVLASAAFTAAQAQEPAKPAEASIPFVNHGGIRDWQHDGRDAIYVQDQHRQWYRATLIAPCTDLPFADTIGFETRGLDRLDQYSTLIVKGQRCQLQSLVKSTPPPKRDKSKKRSVEKVEPAKDQGE